MVRDIFRKTAINEMLHAETIADRLVFLGGRPTTKPDMITVGENLDEMLSEDIKSEEEAVKIYREIIVLADSEGDIVTRKLFENILVDEEKHLDDFRTLLGE
ncbi:bacterioferritin [archaeon BMS3Bbin15]|nr:bacterioferritin [archaeon BMS3Bbin15]